MKASVDNGYVCPECGGKVFESNSPTGEPLGVFMCTNSRCLCSGCNVRPMRANTWRRRHGGRVYV